MPFEIYVPEPQTVVAGSDVISVRQRIVAHLSIMRLDHSVKQVFILPGIVLAMALGREHMRIDLAAKVVLGLI